jgi:hypothetical protein
MVDFCVDADSADSEDDEDDDGPVAPTTATVFIKHFEGQSRL